MTPKIGRSISAVAVALLVACGAQMGKATPSSADEPTKHESPVTATGGVVTYSFDNSMALGVSMPPFFNNTDGSPTALGRDVTAAVSAWNTVLNKQLLKAAPGTVSDSIPITFHLRGNSDGFFNRMDYATGEKVTISGEAVPTQSSNFTRFDIWLNLNAADGAINITQSSAAQIAVITHEIGHSLGLGHPEIGDVDDDPRRCPEIMNYACVGLSSEIGPNEAKMVQSIYGIGNNQQFDMSEIPGPPTRPDHRREPHQ